MCNINSTKGKILVLKSIAILIEVTNNYLTPYNCLTLISLPGSRENSHRKSTCSLKKDKSWSAATFFNLGLL